MKTPVAVSIILLGGALMVTTLFLDYRHDEPLREWLGVGIGLGLVAAACIFSSRSSGHEAAIKPNDSLTDWLMVIVTAAGFAATIYMIYDAGKTFKSVNYSTASPMILDLDKQFVEHPELRKYFYSDGTNQPLCVHPSDINYDQINAMSEYVLDTFDCFLSQRVRYGYQTIDPDWTDWMKDVFNHSPMLVLYMNEHLNWYRSGVLYSNVFVAWTRENPDGVKMAEQKCFSEKRQNTISKK